MRRMEVSDTENLWRRCSSCKNPIGFRTKYWVCNVSTCNRKRTGLVFCSVSCWDAHVPLMNHRESWAEERMSPSKEQWALDQQAESSGQSEGSPSTGRRVLVNPGVPGAHVAAQSIGGAPHSAMESEILVVVSKLKAYIKDKSEMNTSGDVMESLSDILRNICDDAIVRARNEGRRTVMARDIRQPSAT